MPIHPFHICFSHIIDGGLKNIEQLTKEGAQDLVEHEVTHLKEASKIQQEMLHKLSMPPHSYKQERYNYYWNEIKPQYCKKATSKMILNHDIGWHFLEWFYEDEVEY